MAKASSDWKQLFVPRKEKTQVQQSKWLVPLAGMPKYVHMAFTESTRKRGWGCICYTDQGDVAGYVENASEALVIEGMLSPGSGVPQSGILH